LKFITPLPSYEEPMAPTLCAMPSGETFQMVEKPVPALSYNIPKHLLGSAGF